MAKQVEIREKWENKQKRFERGKKQTDVGTWKFASCRTLFMAFSNSGASANSALNQGPHDAVDDIALKFGQIVECALCLKCALSVFQFKFHMNLYKKNL